MSVLRHIAGLGHGILLLPIHTLKYFSTGISEQWTLINKTVLPGDDETVKRFQHSYVADCNMTAIAGAIVVQVAITGFSLPSVSDTFWLVRACFIVSLTCGCAAVFCACLLQKTIGMLSPSDMKIWLTRRDSVPSSVETIYVKWRDLEKLKKSGEHTQAGFATEDLSEVENGIVNELDTQPEWDRSASWLSATLLHAPFTFLVFALAIFNLSLPFYLGSAWHLKLFKGNDARNILIALLAGSAFTSYFLGIPVLCKSLEVASVRKRMKHYEKLNDFAKSHRRIAANGTQDPLRSGGGAGSTRSGGMQQDDPNSVSDGNNPRPRTSATVVPDHSHSPECSDSNVAELITALKASTSAHTANYRSTELLRREVASLAAAIRDQERDLESSQDAP